MTHNRGRKQSQDIHVWVQCFAMYVAVVSGEWPRCVPEMMAYMINIIKAIQEYKGLAWFLYNEAYHRQAVATGHTEWSKVNLLIFTVCFTAKVKEGKRCEWYLSLTHDSSECTRSEGKTDWVVRLKAMEAGVGVAMPGPSRRGPLVSYELSEVCKLYNESRCHYQVCKFRHVRRACKEITQQQQNQTTMQRSWAGVLQVQCAKVKASGEGSGASHTSQWGNSPDNMYLHRLFNLYNGMH